MPLKTEVRPTGERRTLGHIHFCHRSWFGNYCCGRLVIRSKENGRSLIRTGLRNLSSWHMRGFEGSMVIGITKWGGDTSPTFPKTVKDPLASRSRIDFEINSEKAWQLLLLGKNARRGGGGGRAGGGFRRARVRVKLDLEMNPQIWRKIILHPHQTPGVIN